jgi:hypothetical protein
MSDALFILSHPLCRIAYSSVYKTRRSVSMVQAVRVHTLVRAPHFGSTNTETFYRFDIILARLGHRILPDAGLSRDLTC